MILSSHAQFFCRTRPSKSIHQPLVDTIQRSGQRDASQAGAEGGGNTRTKRHEANPAVEAAVKKGSLKASCSLASMSNWYDWMTFATASGNDSSHGTVSKVSWPAIA